MDFEERLRKAIHRGQGRGAEKVRKAQAAALSEEDCKSLHSQLRLELSEHIEQCLKKIPNHFPGFRYETIFGERGWGAACFRDDVGASGGRRANYYSRLEMTIRPYSSAHVIDLAAKGTIRNKEAFSRNHFEELGNVDADQFRDLVDLWVLEYAELYAAQD